MKKCLIFGVLGQDGSFMAELLHKKGYEIYGVIRIGSSEERKRWIESIVPNITLVVGDISKKSILTDMITSIMPNEIYNFAGYSNVINPWDDLDGIFEINSRVPQNILEIILKVDKSIKFFQASSCLIFGKDSSGTQNENTSPNPIHPYGITKLYADNMVKEFRETFGLFACSGIFYTHESERRPDIFFSRKITKAIADIKDGADGKIKLGDLSSLRDYGYSPDYMEAVYMMMNHSRPIDYVIGTGSLISMEDFAKRCFAYANLDFHEHVTVDSNLFRKNDMMVMKADISKIRTELGWEHTHNVDDIIKIMIDNDMKNKTIYKS